MSARDHFMEGAPPGFEGWRSYAAALRGAGVDGARQLRAMEAAGASPAELARLLQEYFRWCPRFRGWNISDIPRSLPDPRSPELALQAFAMLQEPWRVVEHLGTSLVELHLAFLGSSPPQAWIQEAGRMRFPSLLRESITSEGFRFAGQREELDLRILPTGFDGSLEVAGPVGRLRLPPRLSLTGSLKLMDCAGIVGLRHLKRIEGDLLLENCPDLKEVSIPSGTRLEISNCPRLEHIWGHARTSIRIRECPALRRIDWNGCAPNGPIFQFEIQGCSGLTSLWTRTRKRREVKELVMVDCPRLGPPWPRLEITHSLEVQGCPGMPREPNAYLQDPEGGA